VHIVKKRISRMNHEPEQFSLELTETELWTIGVTAFSKGAIPFAVSRSSTIVCVEKCDCVERGVDGLLPWRLLPWVERGINGFRLPPDSALGLDSSPKMGESRFGELPLANVCSCDRRNRWVPSTDRIIFKDTVGTCNE